MESMEEGYIAKIIKGDGAQGIKVGEVLSCFTSSIHLQVHESLTRILRNISILHGTFSLYA